MWKNNGRTKVVVGMSGGVDSAVAAAQLIESGHDVIGLFMKNWEEDDNPEYCAAAVDLADAKSVCEMLNIHLEAVNFSSEYWNNVFMHFLREYKAGRTPNPDILCNKEIKFKIFLDWALDLGADFIATGHYAQKGTVGNQFTLVKGSDFSKDQSYFLYTLGQHELMHSMFPVGHLPKTAVREKAEEIGLIVKDKKDSTGICFIGERRFKDFLEQFLPAQPGDIKTLMGETIGTHTGAMFYTIGQRNGLGVGGIDENGNTGEPWFVASKDIQRNILYVVQGHEHPALHKSIVLIQDMDWISANAPVLPLGCVAKTRYRQADQSCTVISYSNTQARVKFDQPQRAITPGQSLVFYTGDVCLGGGVIQQGLNE